MDRTLELIKRVQEGDEAAKELIVTENTGLIWSVVRRFAGRGYEVEDLYQIGAIGLLKCIAKFDLSYDVKFSTYAVPMIIGEIRRFVRDDGMIKVSRPLKELGKKARYMQESLLKTEGRQPSLSELAEALEADMDELVMALEANMEVESLYQSVGHGDGGEMFLIDKLDQDEGSDGNMIDKIALRQIISRLNPRERQIIMMRYFQDRTQADIAKEIGVSQVQVSRIEKKVLLSMRESLCEYA